MRKGLNGGKTRWRLCLWRGVIIMMACSILYYLPSLISLAGGTSLGEKLDVLHNFYGLDFYALTFFAPVVYAAYVFGVREAILASLASMLILVPYMLLLLPYPEALFRPTAFAMILSAVGAVVAMLQRNDEQRRQRLQEFKCLHDVGKAAEESQSIDDFLRRVVELIPQSMSHPAETRARITFRGKSCQSTNFKEFPHKIQESLRVNGENLGSIEIYTASGNSVLREQSPFITALAEEIGGTIRKMELEQSLKQYSEQLEEMVKERTRELEEAQDKLVRSERLAAVGELASGVGHELRNPLNVIKSCIYLLNMTLADKADEETISTLKLLDQQVDISNKIVTDLLTFTRVRPPSLEQVDFHNLIRESLSRIRVPEGIKVVTNFDGQSPKVLVDAEQIGRALANIVSNALQAMDGKGVLRVNTGIDEGYAWVKFEDTGCGIPEENLDKIFEPLFTTKPKGIGLGLAITKRLVEQNNGVIEVTSQVGKGTTFAVKLPLCKEEAN